ncbi:MAG TPA: adenylate/guanylate cyclase domain-containing protein [Actinomycetota bacterium]|nr:adenylate/guanylate cyclase domain-containing protein [Actinomycetota bacterium]
MDSRQPIPATRYALSGDLHIAYQVIGGGPIDLVFCPGFVSNVEASWDIPTLTMVFGALSSFTRLIVFDKRGTGVSDPVTEPPTMEERIDDIRAVMDASGSQRAALMGISEGGPMALLFAATYPHRVSHLILYGTGPCFTSFDDYPDETAARRRLEWTRITEEWGRGSSIDMFIPSLGHDDLVRQQWAKWERTGASPAMAAKLAESNRQADVRDIVSSVAAPTLVLHCQGDQAVPVESGRWLANHVSDSRYVELDGSDHIPWGDQAPQLLEEVQEFLTGTRPTVDPQRILATVMFSDIVDSTGRAVELGDRRWKELLDRHDDSVKRQLSRFRGKHVKSMGDGFLATFDGPARAVRCGYAIADDANRLGLEVRIGIHTGECEVRGDDLGGIALHIGARVAECAGPGEVLVSRTVKDLVAGSDLVFDERGERELRGIPGAWELFALET